LRARSKPEAYTVAGLRSLYKSDAPLYAVLTYASRLLMHLRETPGERLRFVRSPFFRKFTNRYAGRMLSPVTKEDERAVKRWRRELPSP
jgi:hypothetical protein